MNKSIVDKTKKAALISFDSLKTVKVYSCKNKNNLVSEILSLVSI
tara:strand:- start:448 stop:582 length:135 start_codon:yes stop_codon:yes gene_type:complete